MSDNATLAAATGAIAVPFLTVKQQLVLEVLSLWAMAAPGVTPPTNTNFQNAVKSSEAAFAGMKDSDMTVYEAAIFMKFVQENGGYFFTSSTTISSLLTTGAYLSALDDKALKKLRLFILGNYFQVLTGAIT